MDTKVKLHVGMAADDQGDAESCEDGQEAVIGREAGKGFGVVARCGVAEKHVAAARNLNMGMWAASLLTTADIGCLVAARS
jgi:hypothetical protein